MRRQQLDHEEEEGGALAAAVVWFADILDIYIINTRAAPHEIWLQDSVWAATVCTR